MPDYAQRPDFEAALATAIERPFAQARKDLDHKGSVNWSSFRQELDQGVTKAQQRAFIAVYLFMLDTDRIDPVGNRVARTWAAGSGKQISGSLVTASRVRLGQGLASNVVFSPQRALSLGITETTRTISAAETEARRAVAGLDRGTGALAPGRAGRQVSAGPISPPVAPLAIPDGLVAVWWTEKDGRVCTVCRPLHRKQYDEWVTIAPYGPPVHPRCRCWITYRAIEQSLLELPGGFSRPFLESVALTPALGCL